MYDKLVIKLVIIAAAAVIAAVVSNKIGVRIMADNRTVEWPDNETQDALSQSALHWTIAHVRDDVGSIYGLLCVTNALLAGVLAALIMP
jgi:hypothetical protein